MIAGLALLGVIVRPFKICEAWWACGGAIALVLLRALAPNAAYAAVARGLDVYLFLIGMMALAEFARVEGVFEWIAAWAVRAAGGSRGRLLALVYAAGACTTAFLSNDATIVVLTPAVLQAVARTDARPHAYVFACALVANAASFVLPISNPSNLLFFAHAGVPPLGSWLMSFGLAALASIALTYAALALLFRRDVAADLMVHDGSAPPPRALASGALVVGALVLVATSSLGGPLGAVACALGLAAALLATTRERAAPLAIARGIAWPVVALTAALFVLVEALDLAGASALPRMLFGWANHVATPLAQLGIAFASALASNVVNNLPVGLDLGKYVAAAHPPAAFSAAALVGVNVGPNLTANGSLATLLWLAILRRANVEVSPLRFAAVGIAVTPAALLAAALLAR
ncbi:MAG: arsenic transporter [Candidatus Eremiobacteraeota bacterium]|nr:arsenic transporter [Candidatus Eremiobacteraeota bacterium]